MEFVLATFSKLAIDEALAPCRTLALVAAIIAGARDA